MPYLYEVRELAEKCKECLCYKCRSFANCSGRVYLDPDSPEWSTMAHDMDQFMEIFIGMCQRCDEIQTECEFYSDWEDEKE